MFTRIFRAGISFKLTGFIVAISVVPLLVFQLVSYRATLRTITDVATRHSLELLANQRDYLNLQTDQIDNLAENPAWASELARLQAPAGSGPVVRSSYDELATRARISQLLSGYSGLSGLDSIDLFTTVGARYHVGETLDPTEDEATQKELLKRALAVPDRVVWHGIQLSGQPGFGQRRLIHADRSIHRTDSRGARGAPLGVLRINFSADYLHDHFNALDLGVGSYLLLVDARNRLLFHPDLKRVGQPLEAELVKRLTGPSGSVALRVNDVDVLLSYLQIPDKQWYMLSVVPQSTLVAPMQGIQRTGAVLLAASLLLIAGFVRMYRRQVVLPLRAVTDGFRDFQANRLNPGWRLPKTRAWVEIGQLVEWFNAFLDTMQVRQRSEAELRIAAAAFEAQESMMITDANRVILRVNRAFTESTGYSPEEVVGKTPQLLKSGRHDESFYKAMWESIQSTGTWQGEIWDKRKSGEVYPKWLIISAVKGVDGAVSHFIGTHYDISERKKSEEKIRELAFFDQLTGLPNRTLLQDRLRQAMSVSARSGRHGALLFIDLDNFKTLNDTLGHDMGDLLLKQVAQRLLQSVREGDTVARLGGDEFVVVLAGLTTSQEDSATAIETVSDKILRALQQPHKLGEVLHHSSASIGVTSFMGSAVSIDELMKQADLAMYKSKAAGRNLVRFFDPAMEVAVKERAALEDDLRGGLEHGQFLLHYQPQVEGEGRITGAEVLVRWQHPRHGLVSPCTFIPLAEETGLILPLGLRVLEDACHELARWALQPERAALTLAVNVSARQFHQPNFVEQVRTVLERTGANPQRLKLELTESLLVSNIEDVIARMGALKALGVSFSLDDFGTGYSSLSYLKRLPLSQLKIDQGFVRDILVDGNDAAIAKMIVALAETLGLEVIAEGVESQAQREFLAEMGCRAYQGFLFSRPLPLEDFEALL